MVELEYDKKKKLGVVAVIYLLFVLAIGYLYYTETELDLENLLVQLFAI
jgi:hypothetical protein